MHAHQAESDRGVKARWQILGLPDPIASPGDRFRNLLWYPENPKPGLHEPLETYGAGHPMIGTVLMLFCGLPAITRSL
jgi:hypothetical protein